jgi:VanZ family protein
MIFNFSPAKALAIYLAVLSFLSLNPWFLPNSKQAIGVITWDLIEHALAYSLLSILMMSVFVLNGSKLMKAIVVILISGFIGIGFECGQYLFTSTRQFSFFDATANVSGTFLGVIAFYSFSSLHKIFL